MNPPKSDAPRSICVKVFFRPSEFQEATKACLAYQLKTGQTLSVPEFIRALILKPAKRPT